MTDTTDIAALREAVTNVIDGFQADFVTRLGSNGLYRGFLFRNRGLTHDRP